MARPREFDEEAVLDAAMGCFWAHGYAATSVRDLAETMQITSASLYNAFGDKRALYRRALDHYIDHGFARRARTIELEFPPRQAIVVFFEEVIARSLADRERRGCMLVNTALELAPHDAEFRRVVTEVMEQMEAFFRRCVTAGQRAGTISTAQSADDLAALLLGILLGMRVLARARPERALLEGMVRPALTLLDAPHGISA